MTRGTGPRAPWVTEERSAADVGVPDDGEHGVEVLALAAVQGDLDEELDGLHALHGVGLTQDFRGHPERLLVDDLLELLEVAATATAAAAATRDATASGVAHQLEEVLHVLGGLDVAEEVEVAHGELGGQLHGAQLQQADLALAQQLLRILV